MTFPDFKALPVIECIPYQRNFPCFALPLFPNPESKQARLVQEVDEIANTLSGFTAIESFDFSDALHVTDGPIAKIGDQLIYCFITENGEQHLGRLQELEPMLKAFIKRCHDHTAIVLQILELVGTEAQKKISRSKMRVEIERRSGSHAAFTFYERTALRLQFGSTLWHPLRMPTQHAASCVLARGLAHALKMERLR